MTTRASRTVCRRPLFPTRILALPGLLVALSGAALAQDTEPEPQATPSGTDIIVAPHWSPYSAPTSYPEGTRLHIIQRGDTLWDISNTYLRNPFLWPQVWDANRYIQNPHLIYPGDPVRIPDVDVIRGEGEGPGGPGTGPGGPGTGTGEEAGPGAEGGPGTAGQPGGPSGPQFRPAYEEITIQCAGYLDEEADDDFRIFGSEEDGHKDGLSTGDVVYLNRGSQDGVSAGDTFYTQREIDFTGGQDGSYVRRSGWLRVLAVQEETALAEIVQACLDVQVGDYLKPFEFDSRPGAALPRLVDLRFSLEGPWDVVGLSLSSSDLAGARESLLDDLVPGDVLLTERGPLFHDGAGWRKAPLVRERLRARTT